MYTAAPTIKTTNISRAIAYIVQTISFLIQKNICKESFLYICLGSLLINQDYFKSHFLSTLCKKTPVSFCS